MDTIFLMAAIMGKMISRQNPPICYANYSDKFLAKAIISQLPFPDNEHSHARAAGHGNVICGLRLFSKIPGKAQADQICSRPYFR